MGKDIGDVLGYPKIGVILSENILAHIQQTEVVIDFTSIQSTMENLNVCEDYRKPIIIGTTGFKEDELNVIRQKSKNIPVVLSPNMSVGINLLFKILGEVATVLGDDYDVEVVEAHHRLKKDAPSGTALKLAQVIADALLRDFDQNAVFCRKGLIGERKQKEIGIQTVRAGDIVGEHTVLFGGLGERIEITHKASSRDTFAHGALRAALWLRGKGAGMYDMQDILGLK
ncbi:MAG: 4-hydroxy-tetrahydrodipicolinate reductase [Candidatus Magnetoovum sp. WYHC-5]|nr:4-hydroxy-tetrahydrodipicolinate reductase [Candidatus Magnetoovum sp. WYHC-5]